MPFERAVVVYSVLSNTVPEHVIRVFTTYGSDSFVLGEPGPDTRLTDALVVVSDVSQGGLPVDTCVYSDSLQAYVWTPTGFARGNRYRLTAVPVDLEPVVAEVAVPGRALLNPGSILSLREPSTFVSDFTISTRLAPEAAAYLLRLFVDYDVFEGGLWVAKRTEVPIRIISPPSGGAVQPVFPNLTKRVGDGEGGGPAFQFMKFEHEAYVWTLNIIKSSYLAQGLRFRQAVGHATQVEEHLYKYYNIANGFRDPFTIRTDEPDYTNVSGGYGVLGAAVSDSVSIALPEIIR
jgi:hypothetical protein